MDALGRYRTFELLSLKPPFGFFDRLPELSDNPLLRSCSSCKQGSSHNVRFLLERIALGVILEASVQDTGPLFAFRVSGDMEVIHG